MTNAPPSRPAEQSLLTSSPTSARPGKPRLPAKWLVGTPSGFSTKPSWYHSYPFSLIVSTPTSSPPPAPRSRWQCPPSSICNRGPALQSAHSKSSHVSTKQAKGTAPNHINQTTSVTSIHPPPLTVLRISTLQLDQISSTFLTPHTSTTTPTLKPVEQTHNSTTPTSHPRVKRSSWTICSTA